MEIFQKSVLNKNLHMLIKEKINSAYEVYKGTFCNNVKVNNIKKLKEEEYQATFLTDLFVDVLGYTLNPNEGFNLRTEFKNISDSKTADGAILKNGSPIGVIELKSTKTIDLKSVENQAFGYKNNHTNCRYVIISNFSKLRLYIDTTNEYEEFDLFYMDKKTFKKLYLFLHKDFLLTEKTIKMKEDSKFHEEEITKKLYTDYHRFKNNIFTSMIKNNPEIDKVTLLKKSQKLLDRMLFIFFGEDRGLLQVNTIAKIIEHNKKLHDYDADESLYDTYKRYFKYIDEGKQTDTIDIPKYNGGLFAFDEVLDKFVIDDEVLREDALKLSAYDFNSDIDVNILGHIFENSLNDIDELHAEVEGKEFDKTKTKRKKDGIFYTPKYITKYIVENTVGTLCAEKKKEFGLDSLILEDDYRLADRKTFSVKGRDLLVKIESYRKWLLDLKILDPACGSGAFLNEALEFLIKEHKVNDDMEVHITGENLFPNVEIAVLENNIYGVDINDESVEIAKLSLWLRTAERGRQLSSLSNNIKCGNSLISDKTVAGDKAFDWNSKFPEIMKNGGFDIVIGNPPYVKVQNMKHEEIDWYKKNKKTAYKRVDISIIFFELTKSILKKNGLVSFITSNQFIVSEYGRNIRKFILDEFRIKNIIDFGDLPIFENALTYVSIFTLENNHGSDFNYSKIETLQQTENIVYKDFIKINITNLSDDTWVLKNNVELDLIKKLSSLIKIGEIGNAWAGLFTGLDELLMLDEKKLKEINIEKELVLPIIRGSDPKRYTATFPSKYVIYPYKIVNEKTVVLTEDELKCNFPKTYNYLLENKAKLVKRRDSRKTFESRKDWYGLVRFGKKEIFNKLKIVTPGEVKEHKFTFDLTNAGFSCARVFAITIDNSSYDNKYILTILNSNLIKFFLRTIAPLKQGGYYTYSSSILNKIPIKDISMNSQQPFIEKACKMLELNKAYQKKKNTFLKLVETLIIQATGVSEVKFSNNMEQFYLMDFASFVIDLKKKNKVTLKPKEQGDWLEIFEEYSKELKEIKADIDRTDKEIDKMVYKLYGLTLEEIKIIEGS